MLCPRCENTYETPWMIYNRDTKTLEVYCPDCAIAVMEELHKKVHEDRKKLSEN